MPSGRADVLLNINLTLSINDDDAPLPPPPPCYASLNDNRTKCPPGDDRRLPAPQTDTRAPCDAHCKGEQVVSFAVRATSPDAPLLARLARVRMRYMLPL